MKGQRGRFLRPFLYLLAALVSVFVIMGVILLLNLFVIGKVKNTSSILVQDLSVTDDNVFFYPLFTSSNDIMRSYSYRIESDNMYIRIKSVLVGGVGSTNANIEINGNFSALQRIILEDKKHEEIIWSRE